MENSKDRELKNVRLKPDITDGDDHTPRKATGSNDPSHHEPGAGITNGPGSEERENQERLPPRGQAKADD